MELHVSIFTFSFIIWFYYCSRKISQSGSLLVWLLAHTRREILWQTLTVGKNMVWPYHRRHLDFTEWTFTCLSLPFTAVSMFTHLQSQRRWLPSDSGKDEQAWCVSVIKAPGQQTWWDTSFHVKFFFWPRPVTHNHSHTDTTCNKCQTWVQCVCVVVCQYVRSDHWQAWKQLVELIV